MDTAVVSRTMEGLQDVSLKFVKVQCGAPVTSTFTALKDTLHFDSVNADVSFLNLFSVTEDVLRGNCTGDKCDAMGRFLTVYNDKEVLDSLIAGWMKELQVREGGQFCSTATHVLQPLTNACTVSLEVRRNVTPLETKVHDVEFKSIGIGKEGIWQGTADAMSRMVPVKSLKNAT